MRAEIKMTMYYFNIITHVIMTQADLLQLSLILNISTFQGGGMWQLHRQSSFCGSISPDDVGL